MIRQIQSFLWTVLFALVVCGSAHAQTTGTYIPNVPGAFTDNNGAVCSGCLLDQFAAGTTTDLDTYSDSALTTANAHPIVLDSAGRATIFLSSALYKFRLRTAAGATLWTRDNIAAVVGFQAIDNTIMDGRITCLSATPVGDTNGTPSASMYLTPYKGNRIALYFGSTWRIFTFSEISVSIAGDGANAVYDLFAYVSSISGSVTLERVAWATATTRATPISLQDGVYVKSTDITRRYLGTYRKDATGVLDDPNKRFVWNFYNRVRRRVQATIETTDSWTYTTAAFRQANNSAANQIAVVVGVAEVDLALRLQAQAANTNTGIALVVSIGEDSTTVAAPNTLMGIVDTTTANARLMLSAALDRSVAIGYHFYTWMEFSGAAGTTTWYGDNGLPANVQSGLIGSIEG